MICIEERIETAKTNADEMERLLTDYLPFIKKQATVLGDMGLEYDDMLSLAMLTFVNSVTQYQPTKGKFLSFCSICIKNRLIDESRKERKYSSKVIPLFPEKEEDSIQTPEIAASIQSYSKEKEQQALAEEINIFSEDLKVYGISFSELPKVCPKQERSRTLCLSIAKAVVQDENFKNSLLIHQKLAQAELATLFSISPKTIEKHRKYIVTLVVLLLGNYWGIKAFLPQSREVK